MLPISHFPSNFPLLPISHFPGKQNFWSQFGSPFPMLSKLFLGAAASFGSCRGFAGRTPRRRQSPMPSKAAARPLPRRGVSVFGEECGGWGGRGGGGVGGLGPPFAEMNICSSFPCWFSKEFTTTLLIFSDFFLGASAKWKSQVVGLGVWWLGADIAVKSDECNPQAANPNHIVHRRSLKSSMNHIHEHDTCGKAPGRASSS